MIKIAFYGNEMTFNGVSCTSFGLGVYSENSNEKITVSNYKSDMTKPYKQNRFLPKKQYEDEPIYPKISLLPLDGQPITRQELDSIEQWLHPDNDFKPLTINQDDLTGWHYNCRLKSMEAETYGNKIMMIHLTFEADSVWVWSDLNTLSYTSFASPIVFSNTSSEEKMCPIYKIYMNSSGGTAKIVDSFYTNANESTMEFTGLQAEEILTINTELGILSSNKRTGVFGTFVYPNFLRLDKGNHSFIVTGNVTKFEILYRTAKKVGD